MQRAADAGHLVALEVREGDDRVGVHERAADEGLLHVLAVREGDGHVVRALESVRDDHVAARGERREAVLVGGGDMVERVLAAAHVERVRVREERHPARRADGVHERLRPVRTEVREAAGLAEVGLDGGELSVEAELLEAGGFEEARELLLEVLRVGAAEVGEIDC